MYSNLWSVLLDIFVIVIVAGCAILGYKRGFARTLVSFFSYVISIIASIILSRIVSSFIMSVIQPNLLTYVQDKVNGIVGQNATASLADVYEQLPYMIKYLVPFKDGSMVGNTIDNSVNQISTALTNNFITPTIQMMIQSIVCVILFFIILFILKFVARRLTFINRIPIIGGINSIFGFVLGLIQAGIIIVILTNILYLVIGFSKGNMSFLNMETINNSLLFKNIYDFVISIF